MIGLIERPFLAVVPLAAAMAAAVAAAQPPAQDLPRFSSVSTELVVLPVVVTDRHDRYVTDLPKSRFEVFDNGRRMPIALFSNQDAPVTVGLVLDDSSSLRHRMGELVAAASRFAALGNPDDELFAIRFNDDVRDVVGRRFLMARDRAALEAALVSLVPEGRTALYDALVAGLDRVDRGTRARKVLVLISDGGDNASEATLGSVLARARASNAAIYAIGLFEPDDPDANPRVLKTLARATGGDRFLPRSPSALLDACVRIAHEIRSGYTIGYAPPEHDGVFHRVRVRLEPDPDHLRVRTRPGYFAGGREAQP